MGVLLQRQLLTLTTLNISMEMTDVLLWPSLPSSFSFSSHTIQRHFYQQWRKILFMNVWRKWRVRWQKDYSCQKINVFSLLASFHALTGNKASGALLTSLYILWSSHIIPSPTPICCCLIWNDRAFCHGTWNSEEQLMKHTGAVWSSWTGVVLL